MTPLAKGLTMKESLSERRKGESLGKVRDDHPSLDLQKGRLRPGEKGTCQGYWACGRQGWEQTLSTAPGVDSSREFSGSRGWGCHRYVCWTLGQLQLAFLPVPLLRGSGGEHHGFEPLLCAPYSAVLSQLQLWPELTSHCSLSEAQGGRPSITHTGNEEMHLPDARAGFYPWLYPRLPGEGLRGPRQVAPVHL